MANLTEEVLTTARMADWAESFHPMKVHVQVRFGQWEALKAAELPVNTDLYCFTTALTLYGKALAHAATGEVPTAEEYRTRFGQLARRWHAATRLQRSALGRCHNPTHAHSRSHTHTHAAPTPPTPPVFPCSLGSFLLLLDGMCVGGGAPLRSVGWLGMRCAASCGYLRFNCLVPLSACVLCACCVCAATQRRR
jgi:hypothetical protein